MSPARLKWGVWILLTLFAGSQVAGAAPGVAEGEIVGLAAVKGGGWKLTVKVPTGEKKFILGKGTRISVEVSAGQVRKGERIYRGEPTGAGLHSSLSDLGEGTKKMFGLPNVPRIPSIPKIPPKLPQMPKKNPQPPKAPPIPTPPNQRGAQPPQKGGAPGGGGAPSAGDAGSGADDGSPGDAGPAAGAGGRGGEKGKTPEKEPPPVKTKDQELTEKGFQNEKLLFPAKEKAGGEIGQKVMEVSRTSKGIDMQIESTPGKIQTLKLGFADKVRKVIEAADLKPKMRVRLEVISEKGEDLLQSVTVMPVNQG